MKTIKLYLIICLLAGANFVFAQQRIQTHKMEAGETFYAVSRMYGVSVQDLMAANPGLDINNLKIGQTISVPVQITTTPSVVKNTETSLQPINTNVREGFHQVAVGETLYSISRQYGLSVNELQAMNELKDNNIAVGQVLRVKRVITGAQYVNENVGKTQTIPNKAIETVVVDKNANSAAVQIPERGKPINTATNPNLSVSVPVAQKAEIKNTASMSPAADKSVSENAVVKSSIPEKAAPISTYVEENKTEAKGSYSEQFSHYAENGSKILSKKGVANYLADVADNQNYFAMYDGAPIGTILKVKNLMNNKIAYVKVIGNLPEEDKANDILIKVSSSTARSLGVLDMKFLTEVMYYGK